MKYELIVFDLDGTLLDPAKTITSRALKAIKSAFACGLKVTISTGRTFPSAKPYVEALGIKGLVSFQNSALMLSFDPLEVYRLVNFPRERLLEVLLTAKELGLFPMLFTPSFTPPYIVMEKEFPSNSPFLFYFEKSLPNAFWVDNIIEALNWSLSFNEVVLVGKTEKVVEFVNTFQGRDVSLILNSKAGGEAFLEVYGPGCSKEISLRYFSEFYGVPLEKIVFVGDNLNDIDAIRCAGLGVAMDNAPEEVKREADMIIPSNASDGVACFLEDILDEESKVL